MNQAFLTVAGVLSRREFCVIMGCLQVSHPAMPWCQSSCAFELYRNARSCKFRASSHQLSSFHFDGQHVKIILILKSKSRSYAKTIIRIKSHEWNSNLLRDAPRSVCVCVCFCDDFYPITKVNISKIASEVLAKDGNLCLIIRLKRAENNLQSRASTISSFLYFGPTPASHEWSCW